MRVLEQLMENVTVAVIRQATLATIIPIAQALYNGGVKSLEITAETANVTRLIEKVVSEFGDDLLVGAGTVLDAETARAVIMAGAKFVVSPSTKQETITMTKRYGIVSIPGALTPTEIITAYEYGSDMIKVFPASVFGPSYIKNIHAPFPYIPLMVTGGINLENMREYILQGGVAVGIGSNLVNPNKLRTEEDYLTLTKEAAKYTERANAATK